MTVIQANCRVQFTAEDINFILGVLGKKMDTAQCIVKLLADDETRDLILDDETLYRAILEQRSCLKISTHFYFYIVVRHALLRSGIPNRAVADYVAELLTAFSSDQKTRLVVAGQERPLDYFFEMLAALKTADDTTRFFISAHIGNQSLFLSGVFPERIRHRAEMRGFPDLTYYEELGRSNYRAASGHRLARRYRLTEIFDTLSERFDATRRALNDIGDRVFCLGDPPVPMEGLLKATGGS